ncbi:MAG: hypothetical protein VCB14_10470 [Alphaproteobacteria bacterium]
MERDIGPIEVAVHNVGANIRLPMRETTVRKYYKVWGMAALSAFLMGCEVVKYKVPHVVKVWFCLRVRLQACRAATAMPILLVPCRRSVFPESMARELRPEGIHVAHVVFDGPMDYEFVR